MDKKQGQLWLHERLKNWNKGHFDPIQIDTIKGWDVNQSNYINRLRDKVNKKSGG